MKFRKILCAVDFSETSFKALQWAEYLAKRFDSLLTVLHSIETPFANDASNPNAGYKGAEETLKDLVAPLTVKNDYLVSFGDPASSIIRIAEDLNANLIVVGTRGLKGFRHALLGSTAEVVMRNAMMPVATISPDCRRPGKTLNRILIPVAKIENIPARNDLMKSIVDELETHVTLAHVVSFKEPMYKAKSEILPFNTMNLETETTRVNLAELGMMMFGSQAAIDSVVRFGDIVPQILSEADTELYDFVLMSAHSENYLTPFRNSKSYRIICDSKIPVITVIIPDCLKQSIAAHSNLERLYKNGGDV